MSRRLFIRGDLVNTGARTYSRFMEKCKMNYLKLYADEDTYRKYKEYLREYRRKMRALRDTQYEYLAAMPVDKEDEE